MGESIWVYGYMGGVFGKYIEWEIEYGRVLRGSVLSGREYIMVYGWGIWKVY